MREQLSEGTELTGTTPFANVSRITGQGLTPQVGHQLPELQDHSMVALHQIYGALVPNWAEKPDKAMEPPAKSRRTDAEDFRSCVVCLYISQCHIVVQIKSMR